MPDLQWEYRVLSFGEELHKLESWLDRWGADGWELVCVHPTQLTAYVFKRSKETQRFTGHLG